MSMYGHGGYNPAGFVMLPKKRFRTSTDKNVHEVRFSGFEFKTVQVCQAYDPKRKFHSGFLLTPFSEKEIRKQSRERSRGPLYIKGWDSTKGLWEITYPDTVLKQIEENLIWFRSDGASSFRVLSGNKNPDIDNE